MSDNYDEPRIGESSEPSSEIQPQPEIVSEPVMPQPQPAVPSKPAVPAMQPEISVPSEQPQPVQFVDSLPDEYQLRQNKPAAAPANSSYQGFAIASMVLGICSITLFLVYFLTPVLSTLGLIFGIISVGKAINSGRGMAIAGIVTSSIGLLLCLLIWVLIILAISSFGSFMGNFSDFQYGIDI